MRLVDALVARAGVPPCDDADVDLSVLLATPADRAAVAAFLSADIEQTTKGGVGPSARALRAAIGAFGAYRAAVSHLLETALPFSTPTTTARATVPAVGAASGAATTVARPTLSAVVRSYVFFADRAHEQTDA